MVATTEIESALSEILDPEMPINIVDLGLIENVRVESDAANAQQAHVSIDVTPTFVGCPALKMIEDMIRDRISELPDVSAVTVSFINEPRWSVQRISDAGREALRGFGITVPLTISGASQPLECPFCGSTSTHMESPFGPTRCKMIFYCDACRNTFEHLKPI